jgi:gamma-glutamylcyclotransferase
MYYFAYGPNINRRQMAEKCPGSKPLFPVTLPNYKLIFTDWSRQWKGGIASIRPVKGEKVMGAVYEITDVDLKKLDRYEGYPVSYNRFKVTVWTEDGDPVEAITYIRTEQSQETKPSTEYLKIITQGYRDWDIE